MGTYDVELPAQKRVIFPATCVVCEKENPDGDIELSILGANTGPMLLEVASLAVAESSYQAANSANQITGIPACKKCSGNLRWYHRLLKVATYTAWIPGVLALILLPVPIWLGIIIFFGFVIAPAILSMIFPPAFGATFLNGRANFEFKSEKIAEKFKRLNGITD
jgi:hypothetical protein